LEWLFVLLKKESKAVDYKFKIIGSVWAAVMLALMATFLFFSIFIKTEMIVYILSGITTLLLSAFFYRYILLYEDHMVVSYPFLRFKKIILYPEVSDVKLVRTISSDLILVNFTRRIILLQFMNFTNASVTFAEIEPFLKSKGIKVQMPR
jgi:hypothetical protein